MTTTPLETIRAMLRARRDAAAPLAARRAGMDGFGASIPVPAGVAITAIEVAPGLSAERIGTGAGAGSPGRAILYVHGGAYVAGSPQSHRPLGVALARGTGIDVIMLDYRLAPEHAFPAAVDDVAAALAALRAAGEVVLVGDSAGGGAALAATTRLAAAGQPLPSAIALISPWLDLTLAGTSHAERGDRDPFLTTVGLAADAATYLAGADPRHPEASPLRTDLAGLPPLLVQVGSEEILFDDSQDLATRARAAGVAVRLSVWDGMFHVWHAFAGMIPEGDAAIAELIEFIGGVLPRNGTQP